MSCRDQAAPRRTMKNFLQNLLMFFALALCGLIAFQWVRETDLRRRVQGLTDIIHEKSENIQKLEATVKRYEGEIQRLHALTKDLEKITAENERNHTQMERYKDAFEQQKAVAEKQGAEILEQNEKLRNLAAQRSLVGSNLSTMSRLISDLAGRWTQMNEDLQKAAAARQRDMAVTNLNAMTSDFNQFATRWNEMLKGLSGTNGTASQ